MKTDRAIVSAVTADDAAELQAYYQRNSAHLAPWQPVRPPNFHSLGAWRRRSADQEKAHRAGTAFHYAARLAGSSEIAAVCNFTNVVRGPFQACHLGFSVDHGLEGSGLMREVLEALIPPMFGEHGLHRVMANYMPSNKRSGGLLKGLGFDEEGFAREYLKIAGRWEDHILTARIGS